HSLLAVQLASRIRARLGCEVPLAELFAQPTLAGFAQRVASAHASALPAIVPASREAALPLSFAQQRLWFLAQLDARAAAAYAMPGGVRLRGALDAAALQAALDRIVARHEALRTSFASLEGEPVQVIAAPDAGLALAHMDLSGHASPEAELERLAAEEARAPFDLAHGPLIRGRLIRLADDDHALLVTMHHIVSDGWSLGVLIHEFRALYAAYVQGQPDPLPPLPIQYADYAVWQRRWMAGEVLERQLDYWRDHLSGAPALLELPTDRPRPPVQDYAGASVPFQLDEAQSDALKALSRRHGTTLFMTLLAGWAALLSRLSGQGDVVIGTPVANRHRAEIEPLIGFFVNTQALRIDLSGSPSVAQLLAQVRGTALAAQHHQDIPFEHVVEALSPARSMAHAPLFQVWFDWQNQPDGTLELAGLHMQGLQAPGSTVQFDLMLSMQDTGNGIAGRMQYAHALFDAATIERYVGHWCTLLRAMAADDAQPVARLPLLSASARHELLHGWNQTHTPFPSLCAHQLFEQQVARTPQATAVVYAGAALSYAELNAQANRLAHRLIAGGVKPDTRVAITLPRSPDMAVAVLATLKAGGAYVPLDPDSPAERLATMLDDCRPRVVLTHAAVQERLPATRALLTATVLELDDPSSWAQQPTHNPEPATLGLRPSHLAYVIYTSGSTGRPKGVMVEHAGLVNYLHWAGAAYMPASSVVSSSLSFDATVTSLYLPLLSGGCVTLLPEQGEIEALQALLTGPVRTGLVKITPAHLEVLGRQLQAQGLACSAEVFVIGGEALPATVVRLWHELAPHVRLVNEYGPTETVVGCVVQELALDAPVPDRVPIGRPIANTRIYLLDARGAPVPLGVVGEIHIASPGVARGYLNRPDLSAERFVPDPFAAEPGARMYRTGDLGRWRIGHDGDGTIEFLGRNDHQVKLRGFRIELGEIEARLREHPGVREAVVLAREDEPGDKRLVAYLTGSEPLQPEVLRTHLAAQLPEYMVPAAYVGLDALPLTPNGKLDRRALPAPADTAFGKHAYEAPQGELESTLASIWSELLGVQRIGRGDDFFALGGHSLLAVQLASRIRARLGSEVPLAELFAQPTLAGFAQRVASAHASAL
ncbi:MAG: amino acid adenylation domain-containing protein, partial [Burkholderiales bacterium]|nr:amino acid adenylation domain-containing protein [Burkholderiales bacterium]